MKGCFEFDKATQLLLRKTKTIKTRVLTSNVNGEQFVLHRYIDKKNNKIFKYKFNGEIIEVATDVIAKCKNALDYVRNDSFI